MREEERDIHTQGKGEGKQRADEGNYKSVSDELVVTGFQWPEAAWKEGPGVLISPSPALPRWPTCPGAGSAGVAVNWVAESQRFTVGRLACLSDGIPERCLRPDMGGGMLGFLKTGNRPNRPGESEPGRACTASPNTHNAPQSLGG